MNILNLALAALSLESGVDAFLPRASLVAKQHQQVRSVPQAAFPGDEYQYESEFTEASQTILDALEEAQARRRQLENEIEIGEKSLQNEISALEIAVLERDATRQALISATTGLLGPVGGIAGLSASVVAGRSALQQRREKIEELERKEFQKRLDAAIQDDQKNVFQNVGTAAAVIGTAVAAFANKDTLLNLPQSSPSSNSKVEQVAFKKTRDANPTADLPYLEEKIKKAEAEVQMKQNMVEELSSKSQKLETLLKTEEDSSKFLQTQLLVAEKSAMEAQSRISDAEQLAKEAQASAIAAEKKAAVEVEEKVAAARAAQEMQIQSVNQRAEAERAARQAEEFALQKSEALALAEKTVSENTARETEIKAMRQAEAKLAEELAAKKVEAGALRAVKQKEAAVMTALAEQEKASAKRVAVEEQVRTVTAKAEADRAAIEKVQAENALRVMRQKEQARKEEQIAKQQARAAAQAPAVSKIVSGGRLPAITQENTASPFNLFSRLTPSQDTKTKDDNGINTLAAAVIGGGIAVAAGAVATIGKWDDDSENDSINGDNTSDDNTKKTNALPKESDTSKPKSTTATISGSKVAVTSIKGSTTSPFGPSSADAKDMRSFKSPSKVSSKFGAKGGTSVSRSGSIPTFNGQAKTAIKAFQAAKGFPESTPTGRVDSKAFPKGTATPKQGSIPTFNGKSKAATSMKQSLPSFPSSPKQGSIRAFNAEPKTSGFPKSSTPSSSASKFGNSKGGSSFFTGTAVPETGQIPTTPSPSASKFGNRKDSNLFFTGNAVPETGPIPTYNGQSKTAGPGKKSLPSFPRSSEQGSIRAFNADSKTSGFPTKGESKFGPGSAPPKSSTTSGPKAYGKTGGKTFQPFRTSSSPKGSTLPFMKEKAASAVDLPVADSTNEGRAQAAGKELADSYFSSLSSETAGKETFAPFAVKTGASASKFTPGASAAESAKASFSERNFGSKVPPPPPMKEAKKSASEDMRVSQASMAATPPGNSSFSPFGSTAPKTDLESQAWPSLSSNAMERLKKIPKSKKAYDAGRNLADSYRASVPTDSSGKDTFAPFAVKTGTSSSTSSEESASKRNSPFNNGTPKPGISKTGATADGAAKKAFLPFEAYKKSNSVASSPIQDPKFQVSKPLEVSGAETSDSYLSSMSRASSITSPAKSSYSPFGSKTGKATVPKSQGNSPFGWSPGSSAQEATSETPNQDAFLQGPLQSSATDDKLSSEKAEPSPDPFFKGDEVSKSDWSSSKKAESSPDPFFKGDQVSKSAWSSMKDVISKFGKTSNEEFSDEITKDSFSSKLEKSTDKLNLSSVIDSSSSASWAPKNKKSYSPFGGSKGQSKPAPSSSFSPFGQWNPGSSNESRQSKKRSTDPEVAKVDDAGNQLADSYISSMSVSDSSGIDTFAPFAVNTGDKSASISPEESFTQRNNVNFPLPSSQAEGSESASTNVHDGPASSNSYLSSMSGSATSSAKTSYSPFGSKSGKVFPSSKEYSPFGWTPGSSAPANTLPLNGVTESDVTEEGFSSFADWYYGSDSPVPTNPASEPRSNAVASFSTPPVQPNGNLYDNYAPNDSAQEVETQMAGNVNNEARREEYFDQVVPGSSWFDNTPSNVPSIVTLTNQVNINVPRTGDYIDQVTPGSSWFDANKRKNTPSFVPVSNNAAATREANYADQVQPPQSPRTGNYIDQVTPGSSWFDANKPKNSPSFVPVSNNGGATQEVNYADQVQSPQSSYFNTQPESNWFDDGTKRSGDGLNQDWQWYNN
jgi:hypothetical protein